MTAEQIFQLANVAVLPGWLLLIFLPRLPWTHRLVCAVIIPGLLGLLYAGLMLLNVSGAEGGFGSLADVGALFANPYLLLAGWVHYLAFDLFVGAWEVRDAQRSGIPHLAVVPALLLTFIAGPAGLALYLLLRLIQRRKLALEASPEPAAAEAPT